MNEEKIIEQFKLFLAESKKLPRVVCSEQLENMIIQEEQNYRDSQHNEVQSYNFGLKKGGRPTLFAHMCALFGGLFFMSF